MTKKILSILLPIIIISGYAPLANGGTKSEALTRKRKCELIEIARNVIAGDEKAVPNRYFDLDEAKQIAVLTFFTDDGQPISTTGLADDREDAVAQAALRLLRTKRFKALEKERVRKGRIVLDIVLRREYLKITEAPMWVGSIILGIDGFIYYDGEVGVIFSPAFPVYYGFVEKPLFLQYVIDTIRERTRPSAKVETLIRIRSASFVEDADSVYKDLFRGIVLAKDSDFRNLDELIAKAARHLVKWQKKNGCFRQKIFPGIGPLTNETASLSRTSAILSGLLSLYKETADEEYLSAAKRCADFLESSIEPVVESKAFIASLPAEKEQADSGTLAWLILAFCRLRQTTSSGDYDKIIQRLCEALISMQEDDGSIRTLYYDEKHHFSKYFQGRSLLALVEAFKIVGNKKCLSAAERLADFLVYQRDKALFLAEPLDDSNLLKGLLELDGASPNGDYIAYAEKIAGVIKRRFTRKSSDFLEIPAVFEEDDFSLARTAFLLKGLCAWKKYSLPKDIRDKECDEAIQNALKFIISCQFSSERDFYIEKDDAPWGAFRMSLTNRTLSPDANARCLEALVEVQKLSE